MFEGVHVSAACVNLKVRCCSIPNEAYVCFGRAKDKLKGIPAVVIVSLCVCVCVCQQAEWHTTGSVKLGMTYFTTNHYKSEITPLKSTLCFKHTPTHTQTHVQSQTMQHRVRTTRTHWNISNNERETRQPASSESSQSSHKCFTM